MSCIWYYYLYCFAMVGLVVRMSNLKSIALFFLFKFICMRYPSFSSNNIYVFFYVQHFYHVLTCLRKSQGKGLELAKKHIISCLSELDSMLKTEEFLRHNSACGTVENEDDITTASGCQPVGFDPTLNSRSAAPTPPRAIKLLSWKKVWLRLLLVELLIVHHDLDVNFFSLLLLSGS